MYRLATKADILQKQTSDWKWK